MAGFQGDIIIPDDDDSAISVPITNASLTSLRSSIFRFQVENGRTYHAMSAGKYAFPNDDLEQDRLDIQHYTWRLTLNGELGLCPKSSGARRVLDVGTGTGIWAIEYAEENPASEVIGVDLSPIQPELVPPNCSFEVDDLEDEWLWKTPFDFIFSRCMTGCFKDYQIYIDKLYASLEPDGYLEMQDLCIPFQSDDNTLSEDMELHEVCRLCLTASENLGRKLDPPPTYKESMIRAGFVDVVEKRYKWPLNTWPRDSHHKEVGLWSCHNFFFGLEGLTLALFTRGLGWTKEQTMVYCATVRDQLRDRAIHAYVPIYIVYGRKPKAASVASAS